VDKEPGKATSMTMRYHPILTRHFSASSAMSLLTLTGSTIAHCFAGETGRKEMKKKLACKIGNDSSRAKSDSKTW
jgi:hypothetical protein